MKLFKAKVTSTNTLAPPTEKITAVLLTYSREYEYPQFSKAGQIINHFTPDEMVELVNKGIRQKAYLDNMEFLRNNLHEHESKVTGGVRLEYADVVGEEL